GLRRQPAPGLGGHERALAAALLEHPRDQALRMAVAVYVGGVDEVEPGVERRVQRRDGIRIVHLAPGRADRPRTEADLANVAAGAAERSALHGGTLLMVGRRPGNASGKARIIDHRPKAVAGTRGPLPGGIRPPPPRDPAPHTGSSSLPRGIQPPPPLAGEGRGGGTPHRNAIWSQPPPTPPPPPHRPRALPAPPPPRAGLGGGARAAAHGHTAPQSGAAPPPTPPRKRGAEQALPPRPRAGSGPSPAESSPLPRLRGR